MNKVIIHAGLHKTATTFLQENIWPNISDYTCLTRPYTQYNYAFNQLQYADESIYNEELVKQEISKYSDQNLLLSDESFTGKPIFFSYVNRTMIAQRLKSLFPQAEVILFIRDQKDIVLSHYSSYIRMPFGTKRPSDFFYKPQFDYQFEDYIDKPEQFDERTLYFNTNDFYMHLDCFKYSGLVRTYQEIFDKCHIFLYEDLKSNPEWVISRLENILGVNINHLPKEKTNKALSYKEMEKIRRANKYSYLFDGRIPKKIASRLSGLLPVLGAVDYRSQINNLIGDYYQTDNQQLKSMLPDMSWNDYANKYQ